MDPSAIPRVFGVGTQWVVFAIVSVALVFLSRSLGLFGVVTGTAALAATLLASQAGTLARLGAPTRRLPGD